MLINDYWSTIGSEVSKMFVWSLLGDLRNFVTGGNISGIPTWVAMGIIFLIGLVIGVLFIQFLKIAIIVGVIAVVLAYFGVWGLSFSKLQLWTTTYGTLAVHEAMVLITIVPLAIGFVIGLIVSLVRR